MLDGHLTPALTGLPNCLTTLECCEGLLEVFRAVLQAVPAVASSASTTRRPAGEARHPTRQANSSLPVCTARHSPVGTTLLFLVALLGKRQDLKLARVLGMRPGLGGPVRMAEAPLQRGRLLMQLDRLGMCR